MCMEEQQIQEFVHWIMEDTARRRELALDPGGIIEQRGYSARVVDILLRLVPCLAFEQFWYGDREWWHA